MMVLLDVSLTVKAATLIFISGCASAISSAQEGIHCITKKSNAFVVY